MTYIPAREELQDVAEMMGVTLHMINEGVAWVLVPSIFHSPESGHKQIVMWQPHLPGADCMELMAVIEPDIMFHAWPEVCVLAPSGVDVCADHNNTAADKARALAEAVFKCAVQVARARKESKQ